MTATIHRIGRRCTTDEHFTSELARQLALPALFRLNGEPERDWLIRRVDQLRWASLRWERVDLGKLAPKELEIAAEQICEAAAVYCLTRGAERDYKVGIGYRPSTLTPPDHSPEAA